MCGELSSVLLARQLSKEVFTPALRPGVFLKAFQRGMEHHPVRYAKPIHADLAPETAPSKLRSETEALETQGGWER